MSKYSEQIARIDERTGLMLDQMKKLNTSQGKQWEQINENEGNIKVLEERTSIRSDVQAGISVALAAIASFIGLQR